MRQIQDFLTRHGTSLLRISKIFALMLALGCSHVEYRVPVSEGESALHKSGRQFDLIASKKEVKAHVGKVASLTKKIVLREEELDEIENFYETYRIFSVLRSDRQLRLPANSRVKIALPSFCLDPSKSIPRENDLFFWKKSKTEIPYLSEVMKFASGSEGYGQSELQELVWNLRNKANYEDYPPRLKKVLDQIDSNAKLILPSRLKRSLRDEALETARDAVPGVAQVKDALWFIEGRYYRYSEIASKLRQKPTSSSAVAPEIFRVEEQPVFYASTESRRFSKLNATFLNPNNLPLVIDLSRYHLAPADRDVQRMSLSLDGSSGADLLSAAESTLRDAIIRNSAYWYGGRLTPAESAFIQAHPFEALNAYALSQRANLSAWKHFGRNSEGDESDAFRHFVWAGLLVQHLGEQMARELLSAHEQLPPNAKQEDFESSEMDRKNNAAGVNAAIELLRKNDLTLNHIEKDAYQALEENRLTVIQPRGRDLVYPVK